MLGKRIGSVKKLAKKVRVIVTVDHNHDRRSHQEYLLRNAKHDDDDNQEEVCGETPTGFFAVYVGEERQRFVIPTGYLSHPLFKMLLEKAYDQFGFAQKCGLVVPCSVIAFQEVLSAVECCNGKFDFGNLVEEFL